MEKNKKSVVSKEIKLLCYPEQARHVAGIGTRQYIATITIYSPHKSSHSLRVKGKRFISLHVSLRGIYTEAQILVVGT